jgi:hypothetical protein
MILTSASIIALMLGRRRMSASECIDTYLDMSEKLFGQSQGFTHREKFNPEALERVVKEIVKRKTGKENMPLIYRTCCKTQASRYTQIEPVLELTRSGSFARTKRMRLGIARIASHVSFGLSAHRLHYLGSRPRNVGSADLLSSHQVQESNWQIVR